MYVHIYRERGYYMAARGYEISLRLLKNISRVSADNERNIFFQHEKRNFVSPSEHVKFYFYVNIKQIPNHFTQIVFWCGRCDLLCSHSNGDTFTCEHVKFSRESSPGILLVFV